MADCQRSAVSRDCSDQIILSQAAKNIVTKAIFAAIATLAYPSGSALLGTGNGNACREAIAIASAIRYTRSVSQTCISLSN